jgi:ABC-type multidrug transport system ATPase subunit
VIELSHVSKTFAPRFGRSARALDDVSFRVAAGEVAGISGPAGAGKSTLLSLAVGQMRPSSGSVLVDGIDARRFVEREGIGYLPQPLAMPGRWRVGDALTRLALLSGVRAAYTRQRVESVMRELGLYDHARVRVKSLDRDGRIRLGLAQAILADRRVIVLDEPLDGMTAGSLERLREIIVRLRAFDRAILIASRDTAELQRIADRVTMIDRGRTRRIGAARPATPVDTEAVFHLVLHHGSEHVLAVFPTAISLGRSTYAVRVSGFTALNRGLHELLERGALLASVTPAHATVDAGVLAVLNEVGS